MEDEATQPATQIVIDPRRLGQAGSGLSEEDLADICCILHPASVPAYKATQFIHDTKPALTIATDRNVKIRERYNGQQHQDLDTFQLAEQGIDSHDLVLRLSANLKDPSGFLFGRNGQRCDFHIGHHDPSRRISNVHFKIYINEYGVLMLEDESTNGTAVDGCLLRGKEKENNMKYRHTLENGSVIVLTMTPPEEDWKFHVRIPHRELDSDNNAYQKNLTAFFLRNNLVRQQQHEARLAAANGNAKTPLVNLFPNPPDNVNTPAASNLSSMGRHIKEWKGGSKYNKVGCIGKGAFAVVYKLTARFDGMPYAAKELEKRRFMKNGVLDQKVDMEMKIMSKIKHPNVVRYIEHIDWEEYLYIIMEFVPGGDLGSLINKEQYLPEADVKSMAAQLLDALKYLHDMKITHRDVKPDNILIFTRYPLHVKLTDFGLSKMIDSEETFLRTFCGTLLYCAPEVYSEYREYDEQTGQRNRKDKRSLPKQRYDHAVDIWSLAGVLFYALCGSPPFPVKNGTSYQELLNRIMTQPLDLRPLQRANISESGVKFVRGMLHTQPEYRSTIEDLERSSWFTGIESQEFSLEEEDVDLIDDGSEEPSLEEETSQLSLNNRQVDDSEAEMEDPGSDLTEIVLPHEIPESFESSGGNISVDESYGFMKENMNPGNGRLFGEVNTSALGSSGAIPMSQLNLPHSNHEVQSIESPDSRIDLADDPSRIENSFGELHSTTAFLPTIMTPASQNGNDMRHPEIGDQANRSSSLMGAESMVGHLHMHSPVSATSPVGSPAAATSPTTTEAVNPTVSLRRPREEDSDENGLWRPGDLPSKRQRKSEREIDIPVPASIFWDPKDKSTHHYNYPQMSTSQFQEYQEYAQSKGEQFAHGQKTFETTMHSFRSSRSPSASATEQTRAYSEPARDNRRTIMKRDERKLVEVANGSHHEQSSHSHATLDRLIPDTAHPSNTTSAIQVNSDPGSPQPQPLVGNDFQTPKRILAKLIGTNDSCLPALGLNITESLTSWGRGNDNTIRYSNAQETRIPKYAFKIFLFKPGFKYVNPSLRTNQVWREDDQDMKFFISSKASTGIWINGVNLQSHNRREPLTKSKLWGELKHGDLIDIWRHDRSPNDFTRFRFECYWGRSKEVRTGVDRFWLVPESDVLDEIEDSCLLQEKAILSENNRREKEERHLIRLEQDRQNLARQGFGSQPLV